MNVQELIDVYEERREALEEVNEQVQQCQDAIDSFTDDINDLEADLIEEQTSDDPDETLIAATQEKLTEMRTMLKAAEEDLEILRGRQTEASDDLTEVFHVLEYMDSRTNNPTLRCEHWKLPDYLIPDDELADYACGLVSDLYGDIPHWVAVDWRATGDALTQDMTSIEWEGETYWFN